MRMQAKPKTFFRSRICGISSGSSSSSRRKRSGIIINACLLAMLCELCCCCRGSEGDGCRCRCCCAEMAWQMYATALKVLRYRFTVHSAHWAVPGEIRVRKSRAETRRVEWHASQINWIELIMRQKQFARRTRCARARVLAYWEQRYHRVAGEEMARRWPGRNDLCANVLSGKWFAAFMRLEHVLVGLWSMFNNFRNIPITTTASLWRHNYLAHSGSIHFQRISVRSSWQSDYLFRSYSCFEIYHCFLW